MVQHTCEDCGKVFTQKCNYVTHRNKKKSCKKDDIVVNDIIGLNVFNDNISKLICPYCTKQFYGNESSVIRHIKKSCKKFLMAIEERDKRVVGKNNIDEDGYTNANHSKHLNTQYV
jgi:uncharacterized C2H2 Zn-finger protein